MNSDRIPEEQSQPPGLETPEEDEDAVKWDGSEAQMVPDEDAEEYEDDYAAVKLTYTLTEREWYRALLIQKLPRKRVAALWIVRAVLIAAAAGCFTAFANLLQGGFLAGGIVCLIVDILILTALPYFLIARQAKKRRDDLAYTLKIYPDEIDVSHGEETYEIPLDESHFREEKHGLLLIYRALNYIEQGDVLVLPLRSVEPGMLADVEAIVRAGTNRRKP